MCKRRATLYGLMVGSRDLPAERVKTALKVVFSIGAAGVWDRPFRLSTLIDMVAEPRRAVRFWEQAINAEGNS
jgi:hypothetical protein